MSEEKKEEIKGEMGFKDKSANEDFISKEETLFKVDEKGKAMPEKYPIHIYDREIDKELIEESLLLMETIKKQKAIEKATKQATEQFTKETTEIQSKLDKEEDETVKEQLKREINKRKNTLNIEDIKSQMNAHIVADGITESRAIIKELKKEKEKQKQKKFVELIPCTTAEAYQSFVKGKTITGKESDDWVADLIVNKIIKPSYTLLEAKRLKPDYKMALKEAIMKASNYRVQSYRDVMIERKLADEKPLTLKKD